MEFIRRTRSRLAALLALACLTSPAMAQMTEETREELAAQPVDTAAFATEGPYTVGVSAGYLANSWVVFALQQLRWEASMHDVQDIIVTDAGFNPAKQVADIEDLLRQDIDLLIYWPVDDASVEEALKRAVAQGVPTVQAGGGFTASDGTLANAYISQRKLGRMVAEQLVQDLNGTGKIVAMLPIPGTVAAVEQLEALEAVIAAHPGIDLLSVEYGDWNRAKAKQITENLLQRFVQIDGVYSPAGQMSLGMAEAFDEAGRLSEVTFSPGDEYNGWLKWVAQHKQGGAVTFPTRAGRVAMQVGLDILAGKDVTRGVAVPSEYIAPDQIGAYVDADAPDDWWATELPDAFLPNQ